MIKNPRRLDGAEIKPVSVAIDLNITPLSTATIMLGEGQTIDPRTYIELFTANGSVGVFRTRSPGRGVGQTSSVPLDHAIAEVGDSIINDETESESTVGAAITAIWTHYKGSKWQLGTVSSSSTAVTLKYDHDTVLDAILDVLEQVPSLYLSFNFSTSPWTVNVTQRDATVTAEGRITRNVKSASVMQDDSELCTRIYMEYLTGTSGKAYGYIDADTIGTYGLIEYELTGAENATQATRLATTYLDKHKRPRYSVKIEATDLSRVTGERLDSFAIGRKYRLAIPKYGVTVEETITNIRYSNIYTDSVSITLSEQPDQVINYIKKAGRAGKANSKTIIKKNKEYMTKFNQTDTSILLWAGKTNINGEILRQAGMELDASGIIQYATDNEKMIGSQFQVHSDKIGMVIGTYQGNNYIKAGEIALAINSSNEATAVINAAHVNISSTNTLHTLAGEMEIGDDGKLKIKSAGGMYIRRTESGTTAEFGVWDRGNLTGGVMVQQINDDTTTYITGDRINISATNTVQTLAGAMEKDSSGNLIIKDGAGFRLRRGSGSSVAEYGVWDQGNLTAGVIVQKINGGTNVSINADKVTITGETKINGTFEINSSGYLNVKKTAIFQGNLTLTTAFSEITAPNFQMNSGGHFRFIGGGTGEYYDLTTTKLKDMVKSFSVSGNVLTLTPWYGDPVTFSKAVTLDAAWGSGDDLGKYVVKAYENSEVMATHKYDPPMRLMGGSPPTASFSAEITSTSGSTTVAQKSIYGYLLLKGTTSGSYVEVNTNSSGTGSTVAMIPVGTLYTDGQDSVTLKNPYWNSVQSVTTMRTVTVETNGRPTSLSKSKTIAMDVGTWSSGLIPVYVKDTNTSGSVVAQTSVSIPNVTSVSLGSISSGAVCNCGVTIGGITKQSTVDCSGKLYAKTGTNKVTANGTVTPPSGYIGFSSVEVDVAGGGGGAITWDAYDPNDNVHNTAHSGSNTSTIMLNGRNFNTAGPDNVATAGRSYWYVQIGSESGTILCKDYIDIPAITATCSNPSQGTYLITVKCGGKTKQFYLELTNSYSGGYNFSEA